LKFGKKTEKRGKSWKKSVGRAGAPRLAPEGVQITRRFERGGGYGLSEKKKKQGDKGPVVSGLREGTCRRWAWGRAVRGRVGFHKETR